MTQEKGKWALGVTFIFVVAALWAGASVLVQFIFNHEDFDQPFVLTYICTSLFAVYLPGWYGCVFFGLVEDPPFRQRDQETSALLLADGERKPSSEPEKKGLLSHRETLVISLIVCPLWFMANWTYNQSLSMTSVTSSTIISTTSSLFSFLFSLYFLKERFTFTKLAGVVVCMGGTVLVTYSDQLTGSDDDGPAQSVWGDLVCLFAAVMYSVYTVVIGSYVPDDDTVAMPLVFGYLGIFNAVAIAPVLLIVALLNNHTFDHLTPEVFGLIAAKGMFDNVLSDYLWARAVVLTSPTVATVGLSLTIPLAFITDAIFNHITPTLLEGLGGLAVIIGFILVNVGDADCESKSRRFFESIVSGRHSVRSEYTPQNEVD